MTVIALPLPTLQTRVMDPLSLTHRGITPTGTTRGYERSIETLLPLLSELFLTCFVSLCCSRMVTNRTTSAELVRDPEGCREAALRQYDPEKAFS